MLFPDNDIKHVCRELAGLALFIHQIKNEQGHLLPPVDLTVSRLDQANSLADQLIELLATAHHQQLPLATALHMKIQFMCAETQHGR